MFPTGELVFYPHLTSIPEPVPVVLPALSALPEFELLGLQIPDGIPLGNYYVFAAGCEPGAFEFVSNIAYYQFGIY